MVEFSKRLLKVAAKKRKGWVSIVSDMGSYFYKALYQELVGYELSLPQEFALSLKGLCIYNQLDFDYAFTNKQQQELINHHNKSIKLIASEC